MSSEELKVLHDLLSRLVDESIRSEEITALERLLEHNQEAQKVYLHYLALHHDLQNENRVKPPLNKKKPVIVNRLAWIAAMIILCGTVLVYFLNNFGSNEKDSGNDFLAKVIAFDGLIEWKDSISGNDKKFIVGEKLSSGTLEGLSANSWAEIKFKDDTKVIISGVSELIVSDNDGAKMLNLLKGDLSVNAMPQPKDKPMKVISPGARAEVLGTQFNVVANSDSTKYIVNEGLVRVRRTHDGSVQEVPANHYVVAKLGQDEEFKSKLRIDSQKKWSSEFPRDARRGSLIQSNKITSLNPAIKILSDFSPAAQRLLAPYSLRTKPCLWLEKGRKPELHFSVNIGVSATADSPIILDDGAVFKISGSIDRSMFGVDDSNYFLMGLTSNLANGGFAGKFVTKETVKFDPNQNENTFEVEIPIEDFWKVQKNKESDKLIQLSPTGLEVFDVWFLTYQNIGLEIFNVEIIVK